MKKGLSTEKMKTGGFLERCRASGLKITPQRMAIYEEVQKASNHPSAETIYRKLKPVHPNLSFDTVNRTLLTFAKMGLVQIVEGTGDVRRFDPNTTQHHHFRCIDCRKIIDFYHKEYDELRIPKALRNKISVTRTWVVLEGICNRCRRNLR